MECKFAICFLMLGIAAAAALPQYNGNTHDPQVLRFRILARDLPSKDKVLAIDPYAIIYGVDGDSTSEYEVGRTDRLSTTSNPDWPNVFTFKFDRNKNQRWHIKIYDHDYLSRDDKAGETWVSVNDYVSRGERIESNLNKKGYVTIQRS